MDKLVSKQVRQKFSVYMIHKQSHKGGGGGIESIQCFQGQITIKNFIVIQKCDYNELKRKLKVWKPTIFIYDLLKINKLMVYVHIHERKQSKQLIYYTLYKSCFVSVIFIF